MTTTAQGRPDWSVWAVNVESNGSAPDQTIEVASPATGEVLVTVNAATPADIDGAVSAARLAQQEWASLTYDHRAAVLRRTAQLLENDPSRLTRWLTPESGSTVGKAAFETAMCVAELNECASLASHPYGEVLHSVKPRLSIARKVPVGLVGVIAPYNYPSLLALRSVAPALAVGNAVLLKPDPRTPVSGGLALAELLADAGLPDGLLHVLPGGAEVGAALVSHPDVPCLSFTGSTAAGRVIASAAAPLLKRVHLELGGNNALLVLPDADIAAAASVAAWSSFLHQGQVCMTAGRHIVHSSVAAEFTRLLVHKARDLSVGDPADPAIALGPLIDSTQRDKVHSIVRDALARGATLAEGGTFDGLFYRPTVLTSVPPDSSAFRDEIFGPVAPVVTYDSLDEAVDLVNDSSHGLSVSILTGDAFAGFELAGRIEAGMVHVNDGTVDDEPTIPHGGTKDSGVGGHFGGARANLETFCNTQWVTVQSRIETYP